jgi:uncharacterized protein YndB with AHSA1/START domain
MVTILIVIAAIICILLLAAIIMGTGMTIERTVTVNKPLRQVFDYLKLIKNQDHYSVWNMQDPGMKKEYRGVDGREGFVYSWDSSTNKNVGAGEQEVIKIEDGKTIECEVRFKRPMESIARATFVVTPVSSDQTSVKWGFYSKMKFPMNIMKPLMLRMLGRDLQKGLVNLKTLLEKQ